MWNSLSRGSPASGDSWKMDARASMFCHNNWCAITIAHQWSWSSDNQNSQHTLLRCSWRTKTLSGIYVTDWWNWQIKWMKCVSLRSCQYKNRVNGESFAYLWVILLYFSLESRLIPAVLELGQVGLFWKLIRSRIWQVSHSFKYEDGILILGKNGVFCGHNVVDFSVWFLQLGC